MWLPYGEALEKIVELSVLLRLGLCFMATNLTMLHGLVTGVWCVLRGSCGQPYIFAQTDITRHASAAITFDRDFLCVDWPVG